MSERDALAIMITRSTGSGGGRSRSGAAWGGRHRYVRLAGLWFLEKADQLNSASNRLVYRSATAGEWMINTFSSLSFSAALLKL